MSSRSSAASRTDAGSSTGTPTCSRRRHRVRRAMRWKAPLRIALAAAAAAAGAVLYGKLRWEAGTRRLRARLEAAREPVEPAVFRGAELAGLPAPVERF